MKKIIITALATLFAVYGYSQQYLPLTGGELSGSVKLYTGGYPYIDFGVNSSNYWRFLYDNPSDKFLIQKDGITRLSIEADGRLTGTSAMFSNRIYGTTTASSSDFNSGGLIAYGNGTTSSYIQIGYDATANYGWITPLTQGVAYRNLALTPHGGYVGIGTTDPQSKLYVNDGVITAGDNSVVLRGRYSNVYPSSGMNVGYFEVRTNNEDQHSGGMSIWTNYGSTMYERLKVSSNGNVGIGTSAPKQKLDIHGGIGFANQNSIDKALYSPVDGVLEWMTHNAAAEHGFAVSHQGARAVYFNTSGNSYINGGNVGIGTTDPQGYKLAVAGSMIAESVKVELQSTWPDYVFKSGNKLRSLPEVEKFVQQNHHLPEIPSEAEVKKEGINLGQMDAMLLKKIEELTLYMIEQNKQSTEQKSLLQQQSILMKEQAQLIQQQNERIAKLETQINK